MPSGRRSSLPVPLSRASGKAPSSAAAVVIMIGPKPQQTCLINRFLRRHPFLAFGFERKIDHHDRVLFHDADEEDDADERDQRKIDAANEQREQRADAGDGKVERIVIG